MNDKIDPGERWFTAEEAAELLRMSPVWIRQRRREGSLRGKKISNAGRGRWLYSASAIAKFMESRPDS